MNTFEPGGEYYDAAELTPPHVYRAQQWQRLNAVVAYARARLPFYRHLFSEAAVRAGPFESPQEYAELAPRTRKTDLIAAIARGRSAASGIEAVGRRRVSNLVMTSGTYGFNTFAHLTRHDLNGGSLRNALRELWLVKVRPGMRVLTLSPAWHALALLDTRAITEIGAQAIVPWGTFSPRFAPNFVDAVRRLQPENVLVTAPVLRGMLDECERLDVAPRDLFSGVRYVACAGEGLSPAFRKKVIEELGLDDLFERGGSSDGMFGGAECWAHTGHHIFADLHYVEIVDPHTGALLPPGTRGSAVVTNLTLGRSVYVRFDTEDVAEIRPEACPCGRTHPALEMYGRLADSVVVDGRIVAPYDIRCCLDEVPELLGLPFRIERSLRGETVVKLDLGSVKRAGALEDAADLIRSRLDVPATVVAEAPLVVGWKGQAIRGR